MLKAFIYLLFAGLISESLWAQDLTRARRYRTKKPTKKVTEVSKPIPLIFSVGTHTEFVGFIQKNDSGGKNIFDFNPTIGIGTEIPIQGSFSFMPEINWVLPFRESPKKLMKNLFMFRADVAYSREYLRLRLGTSLMWQNMHGSGGSIEMNNGNDTSTFYYPNENHSSLNNTLDFGAEILTGTPWSLRLQTYVYSIFKEEKRQLSYSLFLTYAWENK